MKKFLLSAVSFLFPLLVSAEWTDNDRAIYHNMMFQTAMEYQTYDEILSIKQTISVIQCIGDYYEQTYSFEEFEFKFYEGDDNTLDEFQAINAVCITAIQEASNSNSKEILL